jgi:hypothetical protein
VALAVREHAAARKLVVEEFLEELIVRRTRHASRRSRRCPSIATHLCSGRRRPRPVFGTIRSMVRSGMERKTDTKSYIREIQFVELTGKEQIA